MTLISRCLGEDFPWGTLMVNLLGSFLLGALVGTEWLVGEGGRASLHALAGVGFCGGLTTFSTFSLQNVGLLSRSARGKLAANILLSVAGCLLAAAGGYALMMGGVGR